MPKGIPGSRRPCEVEGCSLLSDSMGYCPSHYARFRRHGDPLGGMTRFKFPDSLLARMEPQTNGCIWFTGAIRSDGYGWVSKGGGTVMAHRAAYEHFVGPIPDRLVVDHECHNADETCTGGPSCLHRRCVNVEHLTLKRSGENTRASSTSPASVNAAKTHCVNGHEFTPENTYERPRGGRDCRTCRALRR